MQQSTAAFSAGCYYCVDLGRPLVHVVPSVLAASFDSAAAWDSADSLDFAGSLDCSLDSCCLVGSCWVGSSRFVDFVVEDLACRPCPCLVVPYLVAAACYSACYFACYSACYLACCSAFQASENINNLFRTKS